MLIKQISVFVENKPGRLADITKTLATNQVDIRALSIADTTDFGILRLIVNKPMMAAEVLRDAGYTVSITEVIGIGINDQPGGLCDASVSYTHLQYWIHPVVPVVLAGTYSHLRYFQVQDSFCKPFCRLILQMVSSVQILSEPAEKLSAEPSYYFICT